MGRQIAVAMNAADEAELLSFLRSSADVDILRIRAASPDALALSSFEPGGFAFLIHNRAFPWERRLDCVEYTNRDTGASGKYYRYVDSHAPVIEYSRHPLEAERPIVAGRLYWSKYFVAASGELTFDVPAFDKWFTSVMRWIRKRGERRQHGSAQAWFLPGAREQVFHGP